MLPKQHTVRSPFLLSIFGNCNFIKKQLSQEFFSKVYAGLYQTSMMELICGNRDRLLEKISIINV